MEAEARGKKDRKLGWCFRKEESEPNLRGSGEAYTIREVRAKLEDLQVSLPQD